MKLSTLIPKRSGSCNCSNTGAILDALHVPAFDWTVPPDENPDVTHTMKARKQLRETQRETKERLSEYAHTPMHSIPTDPFYVESSGRYWRVCFNAVPAPEIVKQEVTQ